MHLSDRGAPLWRFALVICLSALAACTSKSTPTEPAVPGSSVAAMRAIVTEALSGVPIDGATLSFNSGGTTHNLTTSGGGILQLSDRTLPAGVAFEVSAPGYLTRRTHLQSVTRDGAIAIDLIRDTNPFSLDFYREFIRNQLEAPGTMLALRRWTRNPNFYVNTRNPRTGAELTTVERESIRTIIAGVVPQMTGGQLSAGTIEFGSGARGERAGVVSVTFVDEPQNQHCGWSRVGNDPGAITLNLTSRCETPCGTFAPRTLAHEVGHSLGFYHVSRGDILTTNWSARDCASTTMSWVEQHHARIAYSRLPGNRDPDFDPMSTLFAQAPEPPVVVGCK